MENPAGPDLLLKVTLQQANEVLADLSRPFPLCTPKQANDLTLQLIGLCPLDATLTPELVTAGLQMLFVEYAFDVVLTVCHPTKGLPLRQRYGLKISDVESALEVEVGKRLGVFSGAKFVVETHAKRAAAKEFDDKIEREKSQRRVAALLKAKDMRNDAPKQEDSIGQGQQHIVDGEHVQSVAGLHEGKPVV